MDLSCHLGSPCFPMVLHVREVVYHLHLGRNYWFTSSGGQRCGLSHWWEKAAEALLLVAAVEARLLRNIHIYIYIYILCIHSLEMVEEPDLRMREPKGVGMFPGEVPWLFAASPHIVLLTISIRLQVPHPKKKKLIRHA